MLRETNSVSSRQFEMLPPIQRKYIEFEAVRIQAEKGRWDFMRPDGKISSLDTYSIWTPHTWKEIAERLDAGETCAMYVAGTYGVGKVFNAPEWQRTKDTFAEGAEMFEIKQRSRDMNFVAFVHPDDQGDIIDIDRLHPNLKHLRWAHNRHRAYGWAQHNVFPAKQNKTLDSAIYKMADDTVACFWIPNHWGFEGLVNESRKISKHGIFGGGSLNIHGEEPSYNTDDLYANLQNNVLWLEKIDFVILDEISESCEIGRSQPMVSFTQDKPLLIRHGSLSIDQISRRTGFNIREAPNVRFASSTTTYNEVNNAIIDQRVEHAEELIQRFKLFERENVIRRGLGAAQFSPIPH